jgi:gamma-glutamylcyclotransferase (GGCT)/AIG2-like uncharacterized protein YtfP
MCAEAKGDLVAFYGTLMSAFDWQQRIGVAAMLRLRGVCTIAGALYDMGEWPSLVREPGVVSGELFEVLDAHVFVELDRFEGCDPGDPDSPYRRERLELLSPAVEAWVYIAQGTVPRQRRIASGSWYERVGRGPAPGR